MQISAAYISFFPELGSELCLIAQHFNWVSCDNKLLYTCENGFPDFSNVELTATFSCLPGSVQIPELYIKYDASI